MVDLGIVRVLVVSVITALCIVAPVSANEGAYEKKSVHAYQRFIVKSVFSTQQTPSFTVSFRANDPSDSASLKFSPSEGLSLITQSKDIVLDRLLGKAPKFKRLDIIRDGNALIFSGDHQRFAVVRGLGKGKYFIDYRADKKPRSFRIQKIPEIYQADDFSRINFLDGGEWEAASGSWHTQFVQGKQGSTNPFICIGEDDGNAMALTGNWFYHDYEFRCAIKPLTRSAMGVIFGHHDDIHYHLTFSPTANGGALVLASVKGVVEGEGDARGQEVRVLKQVPLSFPLNHWLSLRIVNSLEGGIDIYIDGSKYITLHGLQDGTGGVGFFVEKGKAMFDDFSIKTIDVSLLKKICG